MTSYQDKCEWYKGSGKLNGKNALVTGGNKGIGRSIAIIFAKEGANVAIAYHRKDSPEAEETRKLIENEGRKCVQLSGDLKDPSHCVDIVQQTVNQLGGLDILVNNAGKIAWHEDFDQLTNEAVSDIFKVNVLALFNVTREALKHMKDGSSIINTGSAMAYTGCPTLIDYSASKGAVISFTRSLALRLAKRNIRVNAVAPGPILTPMVESTIPRDVLDAEAKKVALHRVGHPQEVGPAYAFLASQDSSYITGQTIHINGGEIVNG